MEGSTDIDKGNTRYGRASALDRSRESTYSRAFFGQAASGQPTTGLPTTPTGPTRELVTQERSNPRLIETGSTLFLA